MASHRVSLTFRRARPGLRKEKVTQVGRAHCGFGGINTWYASATRSGEEKASGQGRTWPDYR